MENDNIRDSELERFNRLPMLDTNLKEAQILCQHFLNQLVALGHGEGLSFAGPVGDKYYKLTVAEDSDELAK